MRVVFYVTNPSGWTVHVADSPSCNGGGGDGRQFSNDAEVQLLETTVSGYSNDLNPDGAGTVLFSDTEDLSRQCSGQTWIVSDGRFQVIAVATLIDVTSPYLLRLNPPADIEGRPDALWYVGFNRTVGDESRAGTGLQEAAICVR